MVLINYYYRDRGQNQRLEDISEYESVKSD